jgi:hypothetical protein
MISVCPYCGHLTTSQDGCSECPPPETSVPTQAEREELDALKQATQLMNGPLIIGDYEVTVPEPPEELRITIDREMGSRRILIDLGPLIDARDDARREVERLQSMLSFLGFCYICGESLPCMSNHKTEDKSEAYLIERLEEFMERMETHTEYGTMPGVRRATRKHWAGELRNVLREYRRVSSPLENRLPADTTEGEN